MARARVEPVGSDREWDRTLQAVGFPHPFQSSGFSRATSLEGRDARVRVEAEDGSLGYCSYQWDARRRASWDYGPVVAASAVASYSTILGDFVSHLRASKFRGIDHGSTQPFFGGPSASVIHPYVVQNQETAYVEIKTEPDVLWRALHPSVRKNSRRSEEAGAVVRFGQTEDLVQDYVALLHSNRLRMGFEMPRFYPTIERIRAFEGPDSKLEVAVAYHEGRPKGGLGFSRFGRVVAELGVAQSTDYAESNLHLHDLIKVRAISRYSSEGVDYYDLMGIHPKPTSPKDINLRRFKLKFTSQTTPYHLLERGAWSSWPNHVVRAWHLGGRVLRRAAASLVRTKQKAPPSTPPMPHGQERVHDESKR